jgi:hypothetical protein
MKMVRHMHGLAGLAITAVARFVIASQVKMADAMDRLFSGVS